MHPPTQSLGHPVPMFQSVLTIPPPSHPCFSWSICSALSSVFTSPRTLHQVYMYLPRCPTPPHPLLMPHTTHTPPHTLLDVPHHTHTHPYQHSTPHTAPTWWWTSPRTSPLWEFMHEGSEPVHRACHPSLQRLCLHRADGRKVREAQCEQAAATLDLQTASSMQDIWSCISSSA